MRIELTQHGGIAGASHNLTVQDGHLVVQGLTETKELRPDERTVLRERVENLKKALTRPFYGQPSTSDSMTTEMTIDIDGQRLIVEVVSDPEDRPPALFWNVVNLLQSMASQVMASSAQTVG